MTIAGELMRGRHTLAILRMMTVTDTIAQTIDDYVAIAVRLAQEPQRSARRSRAARNRRWARRPRG